MLKTNQKNLKKQMENNIATKSIGELCEEAYIEYGRELNSNRALPLLMDGLKPVYRRVLYTILKSNSNHFKTPNLIGEVLTIHPHGEKSMSGVITQLVRRGILREDANFGYYPIYGEGMSAAAPRYTETGITEKWYKLLKPLMSFAPLIPGEVEGIMEPAYIVSALPLACVYGELGIGIGINTNIPSFSPKSMLEAYLHDDPTLLEPGIDLEFDRELCDFEGIWRQGKGRLIYKYHVWKDIAPDGSDGVYVSGDTLMFKPIWYKIEEWKATGHIFIRDESSGGKNLIFIGRNKGVRKVNQDMIYEECLKCCSTDFCYEEIQKQYRLGIHDGKIARYIPLREWIDITYNNYINLVSKYRQANIERIHFELLVNQYLKQVAEILLNTKEDITNQDIANQLGIDLEVVNAITRKSISTLKRADTERIKANLEEELKEYERIDAKQFTNEIIENM